MIRDGSGDGGGDVFIESRQTWSYFSFVRADFGLFLQTGHDRLPEYTWPFHNHL